MGDIRIFKKKSVDVFGDIHESRMGTIKWHLLDHVCNEINRIGGLYLNDAGLYEGSQKLFKKGYQYTSERTRTSMDENFAVMEQRLAMEQRTMEKKSRMLDGGTEYQLSVAKHREMIDKDTGRVVKPYMTLNDK